MSQIFKKTSIMQSTAQATERKQESPETPATLGFQPWKDQATNWFQKATTNAPSTNPPASTPSTLSFEEKCNETVSKFAETKPSSFENPLTAKSVQDFWNNSFSKCFTKKPPTSTTDELAMSSRSTNQGDTSSTSYPEQKEINTIKSSVTKVDFKTWTAPIVDFFQKSTQPSGEPSANLDSVESPRDIITSPSTKISGICLDNTSSFQSSHSQAPVAKSANEKFTLFMKNTDTFFKSQFDVVKTATTDLFTKVPEKKRVSSTETQANDTHCNDEPSTNEEFAFDRFDFDLDAAIASENTYHNANGTTPTIAPEPTNKNRDCTIVPTNVIDVVEEKKIYKSINERDASTSISFNDTKPLSKENDFYERLQDKNINNKATNVINKATTATKVSNTSVPVVTTVENLSHIASSCLPTNANKFINQINIDGEILDNALKMPDHICKERLEKYYKVTNCKTLPRATTYRTREALLKPNPYHKRIKKNLKEQKRENSNIVHNRDCDTKPIVQIEEEFLTCTTIPHKVTLKERFISLLKSTKTKIKSIFKKITFK